MSKTNPKGKLNTLRDNYATKFGFNMPEDPLGKNKKGINEEVVRAISKNKGEPQWMLDFRLKAYEAFVSRPTPTWGADLSGIDYDNIYYYIKPSEVEKRTWDEVPQDVKNTFDRLGVPQAEREYLAGVKAQYDSEVAYSSLQKELGDQGVIFLSTDEALKQYPQFFEQYFGKVIPAADNKFAALNSAVWSGGSFVYIPKGVHVKRPLQAYFRINAKNMGQFERTLIIADEGSFANYVEGCFTKGHKITTNQSYKNIEDIKVGDKVLTHTGEYKKVYHTQVRPYSGDLFTISTYGFPCGQIEVTNEHPFFAVKRKLKNERNSEFKPDWILAKELNEKDYLAVPIIQDVEENITKEFETDFRGKKEKTIVALTPGFFRLIGYYLAEGSVEDKGYLRFSFGSHERSYIEDVKGLVKELFGITKFNEFTYEDRAGIELCFSSVKLARIFKEFGVHNYSKSLPRWIMLESPEKQKELVLGYFRGDGNYYNKQNKVGRKELFRINTTSSILAMQVRDILLRLRIVSFINCRDRVKEGRRDMYTIGVGGEFLIPFGKIVGVEIERELNDKKRATMFHIDKKYAYFPIKKIKTTPAYDVPVYNFSVEQDESYVCNSVAVHNCTAPSYSSDSLHAAVVEVIVKPGARFRYTTIQNWSNNVYNLVTKRARVEKDAIMEWVDGNLGAKVTMKYPSCYLVGEGARGEVLSIAYASAGQHQDAGAKMVHIAPNTSSKIISKSVSANGGRTSYRGLVDITPASRNAKSRVECDALILDSESATDTFPTMRINESSANVEHEATVSKIGEEKLFYLMSRGLTQPEAMSLIVSGFIEPIVKELPMEYAVELNRLIELEMEGSVG